MAMAKARCFKNTGLFQSDKLFDLSHYSDDSFDYSGYF
jgi:hypothetical protein